MGSVRYRFIEFFVFEYGSLPYVPVLSLFFYSGVAFPLVALDKIYFIVLQDVTHRLLAHSLMAYSGNL